MKKKSIYFGRVVMLVLCLILAVLPAYAEEETETPKYKTYYADSSESRLVSREYEPEDNETVALVQDMVNRLNSGEAFGSNIRLFPDGVEIVSYTLQDASLALTFPYTYSKMGLGREILTRDGIVKSFVQFPGVETVRIQVGDKPLTDSKGTEVGPMSSDSFVELASDPKDAYRYDKFLLYFTDKDGKKLVPETRTVYYKRSIPKGRVALEQLVKGPMEKDHYPTLPDGVQVRSITLADQACYVDVSSVFLESALDLSDDVILSSVANTLIANTEAEKAQISVNGNENAEFGDGISLYNFLKWNDELLEESE